MSYEIPVDRYRGYYRALKRKEPWALWFQKQPPFTRMLLWTYRTKLLLAELEKKNFILDMIGKEDPWTGGYLVFPLGVSFGKKTGD